MMTTTLPTSLFRLCTAILLLSNSTYSYTTPSSSSSPSSNLKSSSSITRNSFIRNTAATLLTTATATTFSPKAANAAFAPGGTLVTDREIGIQVGNAEASPSRSQDNSNVLFSQDHYFKFGAAAPWIVDGSTDFPKSMPFTLSQQRYDTLKKYGARVIDGANTIQNLGEVISSSSNYKDAVADPSSSPIYALRPMGLLANGFLASENTGTTNELLLARWYVNEIYLRINDIRNASSKEEALASWVIAKKATNSFLALMNRVVTSKVGDKFEVLAL